MDIQMPDIDGIRASEIIRSLPQHASTPIVAVTAHALDGEREQLIAAGMNDYLAKPIDEDKLKQLLRAMRRAAWRARCDNRRSRPHSTGAGAAPGGE